MPSRTEVSLKNFIIFNSTLGPKEGDEDKKLLFYHPKNIELDTKIKNIGLCEAIIKFTSTFTSKTDVQNVVTQKTLQIYHNPEPEFWMILTLSVPSEKRNKSGQEQTDYRGDEVHESIYKSILKQAYASFVLLRGSFENNFTGTSKMEQRNSLMGVLDDHFTNYIENNMSLQSAGILNVLGSVNYLPVNQSHFLRIQAFVNILEATFDQIVDCVFLFNEQVVWSGLTPECLYPFYEYLKDVIFPKVLANGLHSDYMSSSFQGSHYGVFIVGPVESLFEIFPVWINKKFSSLQKCDLLIYQAASCMTCLFIKPDTIASETYEELSTLMGTQMMGISSELSDFRDALAKEKEKDSHEPSYKYLFVNELTCKHEGTINLKGNDSKSIPSEIMNILTDIYEDRSGKRENNSAVSEEVTVKTHNDFWLIRKTSNYRHYFLVLNKSSSTLIDVTEEAKRITDTHIRKIFFEK